MAKILNVANCQECYFISSDSEYGFDYCNLNIKIYANMSTELPEDKVHNKCPLKENDYTIKLK